MGIFIIQKIGDNCTAAKTHCTLYDDGNFDDGTIIPANNHGEFYPTPNMITRLYVSMDVFNVLKKLEKDK